MRRNMRSDKTPEETIKKLGKKLGATVVGIASVADINKYAPEGHRPDDLLIGAKSAIVCGRQTAPKGAWHSRSYTTHVMNRSFGNAYRNRISFDIANFIEDKYKYYCVINGGANLSGKLCAEHAGLGTRSMAAGIVLNRELGLINVAVTVTTMPLKADGMLTEAVCPHPSCVKRWERDRTTPCLEICPECLSGELEDDIIKWMEYNRHLCATRAQTRSINSFQKLLLEAINEPDLEKRKTMVMGSFFASVVGSLSTGTTMGQCGECLRGCPICIRARTLHPKK
jgi:epoxyqueuosine reductase QueG